MLSEPRSSLDFAMSCLSWIETATHESTDISDREARIIANKLAAKAMAKVKEMKELKDAEVMADAPGIEPGTPEGAAA